MQVGLQYAPVRVANNPGPDSGLLLGASVRLISLGIAGIAAALAYALLYKTPSVSVSGALYLDVEISAPVGSQVAENRDSLPDRAESELPSTSMTEYGEMPSASRGGSRPGRAWATAATLASLTPAGRSEKWARDADADEDEDELESLPDPDEHTAIYDIAAHTVYLPDGARLEAHSGLGQMLDDPRYVNVKRKGATPPNVYDLSLREQSFHGVRALRLTPVEGSKMFGRDGILAHSYMLGPRGQSNGCVAFTDYPAFLKAYLHGEVTRLLVVDHLPVSPRSRTASRWVPETIKAMFGRS